MVEELGGAIDIDVLRKELKGPMSWLRSLRGGRRRNVIILNASMAEERVKAKSILVRISHKIQALSTLQSNLSND